MSKRCVAILKSGPRRGQACGVKPGQGIDKCLKHCNRQELIQHGKVHKVYMGVRKNE